MRTNTAADRLSKLKGLAKAIIQTASVTGQSAAELLQDRETEFSPLLEGAPQWVSVEARQYFAGYLDAVAHDKVRFLYLVDEEFYSVSNSADTGYPNWSVLGYEVDLSKKGALYWMTEAGPKLYFKSEEEE